MRCQSNTVNLFIYNLNVYSSLSILWSDPVKGNKPENDIDIIGNANNDSFDQIGPLKIFKPWHSLIPLSDQISYYP